MYMKIDSGTLTNLWFNVSDSRQNAEITASPNPLEAKVIPTPKPENRQAPSSCFLITPSQGLKSQVETNQPKTVRPEEL